MLEHLLINQRWPGVIRKVRNPLPAQGLSERARWPVSLTDGTQCRSLPDSVTFCFSWKRTAWYLCLAVARNPSYCLELNTGDAIATNGALSKVGETVFLCWHKQSLQSRDCLRPVGWWRVKKDAELVKPARDERPAWVRLAWCIVGKPILIHFTPK